MIQKVEKHPDVNQDQFKVNKRLSKIIDDTESEKVEKLMKYIKISLASHVVFTTVTFPKLKMK